jgi:hypothetical protein
LREPIDLPGERGSERLLGAGRADAHQARP